MKIKTAVIISFVVFSIVCCFVNVNASADVTVSQPHFYITGGSDREIFELETGTVKGQLTINNQSAGPQSATLLLVLCDKTSGLMKNVEVKKFDNLPVGSTSISNTIAVGDESGNVLKAFVWNNADGVSFSMSRQYELYDADTAPNVPANAKKAAATYRTITLNWDEPYDNLGIVSYQVYKNGGLIATPASAGFTDTGLDYGTTYTYKIKAVDASGNESEFSDEVQATTNDAAWILFGETNVFNLIDNPPLSEDSTSEQYSIPATAGPEDLDNPDNSDVRLCRKIPSATREHFVYVGIDSSFIKATDRTVTIKITHLDTESNPELGLNNSVKVDYLSPGNRFKPTAVKPMGGTGNWVTTEFKLEDAQFGVDRQNGGRYDFRIRFSPSGAEAFIHKVEIFKGSDE